MLWRYLYKSRVFVGVLPVVLWVAEVRWLFYIVRWRRLDFFQPLFMVGWSVRYSEGWGCGRMDYESDVLVVRNIARFLE